MVINPYAYSAAGFSTEAQDYFDRLDTASDTTYTPYKQPLANYIDGLVALGGAYWTTMETAASFVGVGLEGCLVPLKSGMPTLTNNGFVIGDLNVLTGLLGDTSSTLNTNWDASSNLNDFSFSVYCTGTPTTGYVAGSGATATGVSNIEHDGRIRNQMVSIDTTGVAVTSGGLAGSSRTASDNHDWRIGGSSGSTSTAASASATTRKLYIFSRSADASDASQNPTNARIATYHAGAALNLATLESLQATLISEIAAI